MTRPAADYRLPTSRRAHHALVWRARRRTLDADTGQTGTLVRAATGASIDSFAGSLTMVHSAPRWAIATVDGDPVAALSLGNAAGSLTEYLSWPFLAAPQAMSGLFDFVDAGTAAIADAATGAALGSITDVAAATAPRFLWSVTAAGRYSVTHDPTGAGAVASVVDVKPATGDHCQFRWLLAADGHVQAFLSVNGGAELVATASAAKALVAAWNDPVFSINRLGTFQPGSIDLLGCVIAVGVQSRETLLEALR